MALRDAKLLRKYIQRATPPRSILVPDLRLLPGTGVLVGFRVSEFLGFYRQSVLVSEGVSREPKRFEGPERDSAAVAQ